VRALLQNILIVEPSHEIRVLLRDALEAHGFFVFTSGTGIDGLALLQRVRKMDVILAETELPIMNIEQFLTVKKQDAELALIPIYIMGSRDMRLEKFGVKGFISKPFVLDELINILKAVESRVTL
jgi:two-component system KDP operon response regulator KdpE